MKGDLHHLVKRGNMWWLVVWINGEGGKKRIRISLRTANIDKAMRDRDRYIDPINAQKTARAVMRCAQFVSETAKEAVSLIERGTKKEPNNKSINYIDIFLESRRRRGTAATGIAHYQKVLDVLSLYVKPKRIEDVTRQDIDNFISALERAPRDKWFDNGAFRIRESDERPMKDATRRNIVAEIKSFYRYMERNDHIEKDPAKAIDLPGVCDKKKRDAPSPEIANKLRAIPAPSGFDELEWKLFVELISRTGMRRGECASILTKDVHINDDIPWILAKNEKQGKQRSSDAMKTIPIPTKCLDVMRIQLERSGKRDMLFSSLGHSTKIDVRNLITEKYGSRYTKAWVKLAREIWPGMDVHTWRHYCNIHVNKYFSQEVAMRLLGHSGGRGKINEIYNIRDLEQLRKAVDMIP